MTATIAEAARWSGYDEPDDFRWPVEVRIRPVFGVSCTEHGPVGHATDYGEAKLLRDRHWVERHARASDGG